MADDVVTYYTFSSNLYFLIYNTDGQVWNGSGFVLKQNANWATYVHALPETTTLGMYRGDFPDTIGEGLYYMVAYLRVGASPASTDTIVRAGMMDWTGSAEWSGGDCEGGGSGGAQSFSMGLGTIDVGEITIGVNATGDGIEIITGVK